MSDFLAGLDVENGYVLRCCLAQSGNPVAFSAVGGGRVILDFDDSQNEEAARLVLQRDVPFVAVLIPDPDGILIQRRGRPKTKE